MCLAQSALRRAIGEEGARGAKQAPALFSPEHLSEALQGCEHALMALKRSQREQYEHLLTKERCYQQELDLFQLYVVPSSRLLPRSLVCNEWLGFVEQTDAAVGVCRAAERCNY